MAKAFEQMLPALLEQSSQNFAFSPASTAWMHTLSRFVCLVLQHLKGEQRTENSEGLLMAVLNALEAFATAQALIGSSEPSEQT
jgi:hypothetical protein